jgi:hypothetical protein
VEVAVIVLGAMAVGLGVWYSFYRKKLRREALGTFASRNGMTYSRDDPVGLLDYDFGLLRMGDGRGCENVVYGSWQGLPAREADYWYYTESSDGKGNRSRSYHYFSILIADIEANIPYISISKESILTRMADHLGFEDIQFESDDFNREFRVKSQDREFAFQMIDARMMQWLLTTEGAFGFEMRGPNVLVYCHRRRPTELVPLFGTAKLFNEHVPRLVWTEYGTHRGPADAGPPPPEQIERSSS